MKNIALGLVFAFSMALSASSFAAITGNNEASVCCEINDKDKEKKKKKCCSTKESKDKKCCSSKEEKKEESKEEAK
jgi:hypothetical protein